jgi:hypothetical protein
MLLNVPLPIPGPGYDAPFYDPPALNIPVPETTIRRLANNKAQLRINHSSIVT